ncbi:MAG: hypothetical protein HFI93_06025 [Lachnospiraceae bacterium]|nr:hypothetical protein [Lachnospiraceae bacterium]
MKKIVLALTAAALFSLAVTGCGKSDTKTTTASETTTTSEAATANETTTAPETTTTSEATTAVPETTADVVIQDFSLDIPEGMQELEPEEGFEFTCIAEDGSNINMNVQDKDPSFSMVTADLLNQALTAMMKQAYDTDITIEDKYFKTENVSGFPAYQYRFSYEMEGVVLEHLTVGIDADKTYTFTYTDFSGTGAWMDAFEANVKSIRLIPE